MFGQIVYFAHRARRVLIVGSPAAIAAVLVLVIRHHPV